MDQVASQTIKHVYTYCYNQALVLNVTIMPSPDKMASVFATLGYTIYQICPENLQVYYNNLVSMPILPVFLILFVLYIVFSLIMATLRGVFRLIYNFVRFTLVLALVITFIGIAQQYYAQDSPLLQFVFDSLVRLRDQYGQTLYSSM